MRYEPKDGCPLDNFKPCKQLECSWFVKIVGQHPQTGEQVDEYGCAIAWTPVLLVENSRQGRETGAAVESFRNEMVKANVESRKLLIATSKMGQVMGLADESLDHPMLDVLGDDEEIVEDKEQTKEE